METTTLNTGLTFGEPLWLLALLLTPVLGAFFLWAQRQRSLAIGRVVAPRLRNQLASGVSIPLRVTRAVLVLLALSLAIIALAKPRMGEIRREIKTKGRDVILAIDTSRSMLATDVSPTRLTRAKLASEDLIRLLVGDRIGVIAFAGSAFLQAPLTLDYNAVRSTLDELDTELIPRGGTNIAAAIRMAIEAFGKAEGVSRALVILTDGEELDADGVEAAKVAKEQGIRIFTVGIGSAEGSLIPIQTLDGRQDYVRDTTGKEVVSRLDAARLTEIAEITGGFYEALGPNTAQNIFNRGIEPLEAADMGVTSARQPIEQYQIPLGAALLCLIAFLLLGEGRRRVAGPRVAKRTRAALALALFGAAIGGASAQDGLEQYQQENYEEALKAFETKAAKTSERDKARFNAGAAAYRMGDYAKAVEHFTSALLTEDPALRDQAAYNLGNALVRRGEAAQSDDSKEKDWTDAIGHYESAIAANPDDQRASENLEIVRKLLEDLKKKQEQQQQQNDQQQQQNDQQQQQNDQQQQQNDQQQQQNDQQQQQNDQQQQQNDQQQQQNDQQSSSGEEQDQQRDQQPQGQQQAAPQPTPGERKEGELSAQGQQAQPQAGEETPAEIEEEVEGEMSEAQARALLRAMEGEEEKVRLHERSRNTGVTRDW